jgi:formylglycine-generating enzyme required for sulfatase activity
MSAHTPAAATVTRRNTVSGSPDHAGDVAAETPPKGRRVLFLVAATAMVLAGGSAFLLQRGRGAATASAPPPPAAPVKPACPDGMVAIPGGAYTVGLEGSGGGAKPAHRVTLSGYCLDALEVTTEAYKACSDVGDCKRAPLENRGERLSAKEQKGADQMCNARDPALRATYPINCIDWAMAARFCEARGERLPTEAEWEAAARLPDGRARDLVGNVREWTADWFAPYAGAGPPFEVDPRGPKDGVERVARGGAFDLDASAPLRPSLRYPEDPAIRSYRIGFRCAKSLPP